MFLKLSKSEHSLGLKDFFPPASNLTANYVKLDY